MLRPGVPDLDYLSVAELQKILDSRHHGHATRHGKTKDGHSYDLWARRLFPKRPLGFMGAAQTIYRMAYLRLYAIQIHPHDGTRGGWAGGRARKAMREYEQLYGTLPEWAGWRQQFVIQAAAEPGKQFRVKPARPKRKKAVQPWDEILQRRMARREQAAQKKAKKT